MTYTELYPKLIQGGMLIPVSIPPIRLPYPRWYNENASCEYHSSNRRHSLEDCIALKWRVSEFIKKGELTFEDEDISNVNGNPLLNHGGHKVNAVEDSENLQVKKDVQDVRMPMRLVHEALVKAGRLKGRQEKEEEEMSQEKAYCQYHDKVMGHSIQECPEFLKMIQEMMNEGEIEFCEKIKEQNVSVLLEEVRKPLTVSIEGEVNKHQRRYLRLPPLNWL